MSRKKIILILVFVIIAVVIYFWFNPLTHTIAGAETVKNSEIGARETGITYAPQNYSLFYRALWFKDYPFLEKYFPINPVQHIRQEPINSFANLQTGLFVAKQQEYGGSTPAKALLVFNRDGSFIKTIDIPLNIASQIGQVQWVNNKILTSGWDSAVRFQQYIVDPNTTNPEFVPLPTGEKSKWNFTPYTTTVTDHIVVGKLCSRGYSNLGGNFSCTQTSVQTFDSNSLAINTVLVRNIPDSRVCIGAKDNKIFVKEITDEALQSTYGDTQKETSDPTFGIYDSCNNTKSLNGSQTRLTVIPVELIK